MRFGSGSASGGWMFGAFAGLVVACSGERTEERDGAAASAQSDTLAHPMRTASPTASPTEAPPAPLTAAPPTPRAPRPKLAENPFIETRVERTSTFSADVDTASYTRLRASLTAGVLPRPEDVRIEEMLNYFRFSYPAPSGAAFGFLTDVARAPWDPERRLVRIGIKGREVAAVQRPPANLVLLIDASGSMAGPKKIGLLRDGFAMLAEKLDARDTVAIVAYAGRAGVILPPTSGDKKARIINALDAFETGGATDGSLGIQRGYELAAQGFKEGGINRVILATDGDFNLGVTQRSELEGLIGRKARTGIFLTVLGFDNFNPNDKTLELLADKGNGHYAFVDGVSEARRVLVDDLSGTLQTIAKDVKIQVRWNPEAVESYRLIGYENRALAATEFRDDSKDAGEIGAGHTVTALYDVKPTSQRNTDRSFGTIAIRYKDPDGTEAREVEASIGGADTHFPETSTDFRFAASVAAFGMLLRSSPYKGDLTYGEVGRWAADAIGDDPNGQRSELSALIKRAAERFEVAKGAKGKSVSAPRPNQPPRPSNKPSNDGWDGPVRTFR